MTYDLPTTAHDDTFRPMSFLFPFSLTGLSIELKIFILTQSKIKLVKIYTTSDNLEIDPAESKRLKIIAHLITIEPGNYTYKLKLNPNGIRSTYLSGNWIITN